MRSHCWRLLFAALCTVLLCGAFGYVGDASATSTLSGTVVTAPTAQPEPGTVYSGSLFCPYNYDAVFGRIVHCIETMIKGAAKSFLEGFMPVYESIVLALMVLAVTIYGGLTIVGAIQRPIGQSFILLFKISAVAFFAIQFGNSIDWVFSIMQGLMQVVTAYTPVSSGLSFCSDDGNVSAMFEQYQRTELTAWDRVDCMFMNLLGIGLSRTAAIGIVALLCSFFFLGGLGLMIVVIAAAFVVTLLVSLVRAVKIYLSCMITVAFLVCLSPMFIPLILFEATRGFFDKWVKALANYMVMPIFLFAYLTMMIASFDVLIYRGQNSMYYAIANEASQVEGFNFRDWLEFGVAGEVGRDANGKVVFDADGMMPTSVNGRAATDADFVGKGIPDQNAMTIMGYMKLCSEASEDERDAIKEICDLELEQMLSCALNPRVARDGVAESTDGESSDCTSAPGRPYYGFQMNQEILHFGIAYDIKTDAEKRQEERERQECLSNPWCAIGYGISKVGGFVFDVGRNVVGTLFRAAGWLAQRFGDVLNAIGTFIDNVCRQALKAPGAVCDATGGSLMVISQVVSGVGTVVDFGGRVAIEGIGAVLGEMLKFWFDVLVIDLQKVASYRCQLNPLPLDGDYGAGFNSLRDAYLACPGPEALVIDILYVIITILVVTYLLQRWLNYIPVLGKTLVGNVRLKLNLPGEQKAVQIVNTAESAISKGGLSGMKRRQ